MSLKKLALSLTTLATVVLVSVAFAPADQQANVISDPDCSISGDPIGAGFIASTRSHAVVTPSGNTQFKCTADIPDGFAPSQAVRVTGLGCLTPGGYTYNTTNLYTPSGKAHLTCSVKASGQ